MCILDSYKTSALSNRGLFCRLWLAEFSMLVAIFNVGRKTKACQIYAFSSDKHCVLIITPESYGITGYKVDDIACYQTGAPTYNHSSLGSLKTSISFFFKAYIVRIITLQCLPNRRKKMRIQHCQSRSMFSSWVRGLSVTRISRCYKGTGCTLNITIFT